VGHRLSTGSSQGYTQGIEVYSSGVGMNFLRVAARIVESFDHTSYLKMGRGWWMTPDGEVHSLGTDVIHEKFAAKWLEDNGHGEFPVTEKTEEDLIRMGGISVREYNGHIFASVPELSKKNFDKVFDILQEAGVHGSGGKEILLSKISRRSDDRVNVPIEDFLRTSDPAKLKQIEKQRTGTDE
jgi:hypothetical protein